MFGLPTWLLIIPVLAFLIFVHELGHFLAAKRFGIKVLEFGFGFPPRLFGVRRGETIYSINAIPLGGFVRMLGEDNAAGVPDSAEQSRLEEEFNDPDAGRRFTDQTPLKRAIVLVAGSFMNFLTPVVIFTIIFLLPRDVPVGTVVINGVAPRSPAAEAGIRPGDQILAVNGERVRNHFELIDRVKSNLGTETEFNVRRGSIVSGLGQSPDVSVVESVSVVPRSDPPSFQVVESVTDSQTQVSLREARRYDGQLRVGDTLTQGAVGGNHRNRKRAVHQRTSARSQCCAQRRPENVGSAHTDQKWLSGLGVRRPQPWFHRTNWHCPGNRGGCRNRHIAAL